MSYNTIEEKILSKLQKNNSCIKILESNKKIITEYLVNDDKAINSFVEKLIPTILKAKKYNDIEKSLKHPLFEKVLAKLRESDALIQACKNNNKKASKWLVTMKVNPAVKDKMGMNGLMHAVEHYALKETVEEILKLPERNFINDEDMDGNTALFHAVKNKELFDLLLGVTTKLNHVNKENENIITYTCKLDKIRCFVSALCKANDDVDVNIFNNDGKNAAMYLVQNGRFQELRGFSKYCKKLDVNCRNKDGESLVSMFIKSYYNVFKDEDTLDESKPYRKETTLTDSKALIEGKKYGRTANALIDMGCDFNVQIDSDGNTAMNFFLMIKDYVSAINLIEYCPSVDLSLTNKYGVSANHLVSSLTKEDFSVVESIKNSLLVKVNYDIFKEKFYSHPTFKYSSFDNTKVISPYIIPSNYKTLERVISEGYFCRKGEDTERDVFDTLYNGIMMTTYHNRFVV